MTWYLDHQHARQLIAERQRQADQVRLAHLTHLAEEGRAPATRRAAFAGPRHVIAKAILSVGRSATRLAEALDVDMDPASGTAAAR